MPSHYATLGVHPDADEAIIRAAYRRLMRDAHPDRGGDAQTARRLNEAFDVLTDPQQRAAHDAKLRDHDSHAATAQTQGNEDEDEDEPRSPQKREAPPRSTWSSAGQRWGSASLGLAVIAAAIGIGELAFQHNAAYTIDRAQDGLDSVVEAFLFGLRFHLLLLGGLLMLLPLRWSAAVHILPFTGMLTSLLLHGWGPWQALFGPESPRWFIAGVLLSTAVLLGKHAGLPLVRRGIRGWPIAAPSVRRPPEPAPAPSAPQTPAGSAKPAAPPHTAPPAPPRATPRPVDEWIERQREAGHRLYLLPTGLADTAVLSVDAFDIIAGRIEHVELYLLPDPHPERSWLVAVNDARIEVGRIERDRYRDSDAAMTGPKPPF